MKIIKKDIDRLMGYKVFKINNHTYQFTINIKMGGNVEGFNDEIFVKMFTDNGWVNIVDNRFLGLPDINIYELKKDYILDKIEKYFKIFKSYIEDLEGIKNDN